MMFAVTVAGGIVEGDGVEVEFNVGVGVGFEDGFVF